MASPARSAVVINPVKVDDLDVRREEICAALANVGWPEPCSVSPPGRRRCSRS